MKKNEKFINRNTKNQKKIENFWDKKTRYLMAHLFLKYEKDRIHGFQLFTENLNFWSKKTNFQNFQNSFKIFLREYNLSKGFVL